LADPPPPPPPAPQIVHQSYTEAAIRDSGAKQSLLLVGRREKGERSERITGVDAVCTDVGGGESRPEMLEMVRDCVGFLKDNSEVWKTRTPEENKMMNGKERNKRMELLKRKQKKIGKVVKNLTKMESE
jgi:hypothetical protein